MAIGTFIDMELTSKCNFHCPFCNAKDHQKDMKYQDMDFDKYVEILEEAKDINIFGIYYNTVLLNGGGEPFLYKKLIEAVIEAKRRFKYVGFISNGSLLTEQKANDLLNIGIDRIYISITGIKIDIYSKFQGAGISQKQCEKQLENVIKNIKYLCKRRKELHKKTYIALRYIASEESRTHLKEYAGFWKKEGVDEIIVTSLWNYNRQIKSKHKILRCQFVARRILISANGEVYPCANNYDREHHFMGNVHDKTLQKIVYSDLFINEKKARMNCEIDIVPKSCLSCEQRYLRDIGEELGNMRQRIFPNKPFKTLYYKLFGLAVIVFERVTRVKFFYDLYLAYLRYTSSKIREKYMRMNNISTTPPPPSV